MKQRLTVTLDQNVYDKLPRRNRSGIVNQILKDHFLSAMTADIAGRVAEILLNDKNFTARITKTRFELTTYKNVPHVIDLQTNELFEIGDRQ